MNRGKASLPAKSIKTKDPTNTLNHILTVDTEVSTSY